MTLAFSVTRPWKSRILCFIFVYSRKKKITISLIKKWISKINIFYIILRIKIAVLKRNT